MAADDFDDAVFDDALTDVTRRSVEAVTVAGSLGTPGVVLAAVEFNAAAMVGNIELDGVAAGGAPPDRSASNACAACGFLARKLRKLLRLGVVLVPLLAKELSGRVAFVNGADDGLTDWAACAPEFVGVVVFPCTMDWRTPVAAGFLRKLLMMLVILMLPMLMYPEFFKIVRTLLALTEAGRATAAAGGGGDGGGFGDPFVVPEFEPLVPLVEVEEVLALTVAMVFVMID